MSELAAPPIDAEVDLTDFPFMPLDVRRLRDSKLAARVTGEEFRAAVLLWCASWHQIPAGSLPDDDIELAQLAGYGRVISEWDKVKLGALHGWTLCSDGRFYHEVVVEKALEAWAGKQQHAYRREAERIRKENYRRKDDRHTLLTVPTFDQWLSYRKTGVVTWDKEQCHAGHINVSGGTSGDVTAENALIGTGTGTGTGTGILGSSKKPLPLGKGLNGADAPTERKPRAIRKSGLDAWDRTCKVIDAFRSNTNGLTWADADKTLNDPLAVDAIKAAGGHKAIAGRTQFTQGEIKRLFRHAYESALETRKGSEAPSAPELNALLRDATRGLQ